MVYFIQVGSEGLVKIGHSGDPTARMRALQTSHAEALRLLGVVRGGRREELEIHRKFAGFRVSGEWFLPDMKLLEFAWYGKEIPPLTDADRKAMSKMPKYRGRTWPDAAETSPIVTLTAVQVCKLCEAVAEVAESQPSGTPTVGRLMRKKVIERLESDVGMASWFRASTGT
jgi:hypothetical protein